MSWGPLQILLILVIVLLLFGTKKLRGLGSDLGNAIKGFKKSMGDEEEPAAADKQQKVTGEQASEKKE